MTFTFDMESLPTLPVIAGQIMECMNDPNSSIQDLANVIMRDQSMSAKILKLVNSAFYGFPKRIGTISHAISILGFETVRGLVLGVSILDTFRIKEFDLLDFWRHSIRTASCMAYLSERLNYPRRDEAFTVGLMHDVGKLVFMLKAPEQYHQVLSGEGAQLERETNVFGVNHAQIGARVAQAWNFPDSYVQGIECHHHHPEMPFQNPSLRNMVYYANLLDHLMETPAESRDLEPHQAWLDSLDLNLEEVEAHMDSIQTEISEFLNTLTPSA